MNDYLKTKVDVNSSLREYNFAGQYFNIDKLKQLESIIFSSLIDKDTNFKLDLDLLIPFMNSSLKYKIHKRILNSENLNYITKKSTNFISNSKDKNTREINNSNVMINTFSSYHELGIGYQIIGNNNYDQEALFLNFKSCSLEIPIEFFCSKICTVTMQFGFFINDRMNGDFNFKLDLKKEDNCFNYGVCLNYVKYYTNMEFEKIKMDTLDSSISNKFYIELNHTNNSKPEMYFEVINEKFSLKSINDTVITYGGINFNP